MTQENPGRPAEFADRVALVTGGAGAIGAATVKAFREHGARVVAADSVAGTPWQEADLAAGDIARIDVRQREHLAALVERIEKTFGAPVDTLVNVAGVVSFGFAETLAEEEWDRVLDINLKGTFLACQAVMPGMKAAGFGRIINIGSVVAKTAGSGRPWIDPAEQRNAGNVAYGVSKAGVHIMTGFLAKELAAFGITVNAVAPGPIASPMTTNFPETLRALLPVGRMGTGFEVARAILFLASRDAGFITGEVMDINGGMRCD
jgi:NAD(P)-dependent dehydrogenase (short-subunit alcohol dehydrogenase family)